MNGSVGQSKRMSGRRRCERKGASDTANACTTVGARFIAPVRLPHLWGKAVGSCGFLSHDQRSQEGFRASFFRRGPRSPTAFPHKWGKRTGAINLAPTVVHAADGRDKSGPYGSTRSCGIRRAFSLASSPTGHPFRLTNRVIYYSVPLVYGLAQTSLRIPPTES
jgi:hypothetical protein